MTIDTAVSKPLPSIDSISKPFWDAAAEHVLRIQRCTGCGRWQHTPVVCCPVCSGELDWAEASGRGTVHTFTIIRQVYHPAFTDEVPYNVAVVELEEGPFMVTNVVGCDENGLRIDMPVEVTFEDVADGMSIPKFAPADGAR